MALTLWITRSQPGAQRLAAALAHSGLNLQVAPVQEIIPTGNWQQLAQAEQQPPALVLVTSQHAATAYVSSMLAARAVAVVHVAVGDATAAILRDYGFEVVVPAEHASEGMLGLPQLKALPRTSVVWLIAGEGGRNLLQSELAKQGVRALKFEFYRRAPVTPAALNALPDLVEIASLEGLRLVMETLRLTGRVPMPRSSSALPFMVVASPRIAEAARDHGVPQIECARGPEVAVMKEAVLRAVSKISQGKQDG